MTVEAELRALADRGDGIIYPAIVVDWAKGHPRSDLHGQFDWDVNRAAYQHWLSQARRLIAVHVVDEVGHRETVALRLDLPVGGYRPLGEVMSTADLRKAAVAQAVAELERWADRHSHLKELAGIFRTIVRFAAKLYPPESSAAPKASRRRLPPHDDDRPRA